MPAPRVFLHRYISWFFVVVSLVTVATGYVVSRGLFPDFVIFSTLHRGFEIMFLGYLVAHVLYTVRHFKLNLRETVNKIGWGRKNSIYLLRIAQRVSSWLIILATLGMVLTGLNGYPIFAQAIEDVIPFDPHRIFDVLLISAIIIHFVIGIRFVLMRRRVNTKIARRISLTIAVVLLVLTMAINVPAYEPPIEENGFPTPGSVFATVDGNYIEFNPDEVLTTRPDIFKPGFFSMFDVLVHLDNIGEV